MADSWPKTYKPRSSIDLSTKPRKSAINPIGDDAWPVVIDRQWRLFPDTLAEHVSQGRWVRYPWLSWLGYQLATAIGEGSGRILISAPIRHGKSELVSVWLPVWVLELWPQWRVILTSYEATIAAGWGRRVRNIFDASRDKLVTRLAADSKAADVWHTTEGGGMFTAGVGGPLTGRGGEVIIIDDFCKNSEEADSELMRHRAKEWVDSTLLTRAEPGATIIVMAARWHEDDLYAYLKAKGGWTDIKLPALAEKEDPLGRDEGEPLCPERFDLAALAKSRRVSGERWWQALYQQNPSSEEGNELKRQWWKWYRREDLPHRWDFVVASWDCSFKDGESSDYVVGQVWGAYGRRRYLLGQVRGRYDFPTTLAKVQEVAKRYEVNTTIVEDKANGSAVIQTLRQRAGSVIAIEPQGGKVVRARAVSSQIEGGDVYLPDAELFAKELVEECAKFPRGRHDDMVDAMSQALTYLSRFRGSDRMEGMGIGLSSSPRLVAEAVAPNPIEVVDVWGRLMPMRARR